MDINWKAVIIGFILANCLKYTYSVPSSELGEEYLGYLLATIYVGYTQLADEWMNGAIHGALVGVIGGIILVNISHCSLGAVHWRCCRSAY